NRLIDTKPGMRDIAQLHEVARDFLNHVARNGEANAGAASGLRNDRRVDTDNLAGRVEQWPAGVAGVDGGVGLNNAVDNAAILGLDRTAERTDDSDGQRSFQSVRITDRQDFLSDQ